MAKTPALPKVMHQYLCWEKRPAVYTNFYLKPDERRQLIKECGTAGLVLFEYYLYMAKQSSLAEEISDARTAEWFGWSEPTAKRHRLNLIRHEWLHIESFKGVGHSHRAKYYYLGQPLVRQRKSMQ